MLDFMLRFYERINDDDDDDDCSSELFADGWTAAFAPDMEPGRSPFVTRFSVCRVKLELHLFRDS